MILLLYLAFPAAFIVGAYLYDIIGAILGVFIVGLLLRILDEGAPRDPNKSPSA